MTDVPPPPRQPQTYVPREAVPFPIWQFWPVALVAGILLVGLALVVTRPDAPVPPEARGFEVGTIAPSAQGGGTVPEADALVLVTSTPSGATIAVDGDTVGTTPFLVQGVAAGVHEVVVSRPGYVPSDTSLAFGPGVSLRVALRPGEAPRPAPAPAPAALPPAPPVAAARPAPPPPVPAASSPQEPGRLAIAVQPWGTISIDGQVRQRDADVTYQTDVAPGTYRIRATHPALGEQERTVTVRPGQSLRVTFDLNEPAP